jgi:hypothetical protein
MKSKFLDSLELLLVTIVTLYSIKNTMELIWLLELCLEEQCIMVAL